MWVGRGVEVRRSRYEDSVIFNVCVVGYGLILPAPIKVITKEGMVIMPCRLAVGAGYASPCPSRVRYVFSVM